MLKTLTVENQEFKLPIWTIGKEKEVLLKFGEYVNLPFDLQIIEMSALLAPDILRLHPLMQLYILVQLGAHANTNSKHINYVCPHCGAVIDTSIDIIENLHLQLKDLEFEINGKKILLDKDISKIKGLNCGLDDLTLTEYKEVEKQCNEMEEPDLYLLAECLCFVCNKTSKVIRNKEVLFENYVIGLDLQNYYEILKYFVKELGFTVTDFNNLYPFEVQILSKKDE